MSKRFAGRVFVVLILSVLLVGCFRQASPNISPPVNTPPPATLLPTPAAMTATPFITPFGTGTGPDITNMPTLEITATVPLALTGEADAGESPATPTVERVQPALGPSPTIPFAAGPTYTPVPGAPPVNLNPNLPTPTSASAGGAGPEGADCTYRVQSGDTAFYIATLHGITLDQLIEYNRLEDANRLFEGQELLIPNCGTLVPDESEVRPVATSAIQPPLEPTPTDLIPRTAPDGSTIHVVQAGENLFRIALRYGVSVDAIVAANGLGSQDAILAVGQQLIIPTE
ncbi:MAG: hypothetical protein Kow0077_25090 [Anaerolineae bacterium]